MITIADLQERFSERFTSIDPIGTDLARCVRSRNGAPFAIYYVDVSKRVPTTIRELDDYQDANIANRYFEGATSLQWSHYLYFVVDSQVPPETRMLIERDRKFARKFVVNEGELVSALTPPKYQIAEGAIDANVLNTWTQLLAEANLDQAVINDDSLANRVKRIEAGFGHKGMKAPSAIRVPSKETPPFISEIEIVSYRQAHSRRFDFGEVTLVTGPNGTGKTSLLEAIELVYCGINKRDQKAKLKYDIRAKFRDGRVEEARNGVPSTQEFRDRNLAWYGQADTIRSNTLYQSFSRYNFLDTDAAVGLANSDSDFEEDLSKLLVGPETSKLWREIERTANELKKEIRQQTSIQQQLELELQSVERQIDSAAAVPKESDAFLAAAAKAIKASGGEVTADVLKERIADLLGDFGSAESIIEQLLNDEDEAVNSIGIRNLIEIQPLEEELIAKAESLFAECKSIHALYAARQKKIADIAKRLDLLKEALPFAENKVVQINTDLEVARASLQSKRLSVAGIDDYKEMLLELPENGQSVSDLQGACDRELVEAQEELARAQQRLKEFNDLSGRAMALAQQLREIAAQILETSDNPDRCPLCHTAFGDGELKAEIMRDVDQQILVRTTSYNDAVRKAEDRMKTAGRRVSFAAWVARTSTSMGLGASIALIKVRDVILETTAEIGRQEVVIDQSEVIQRSLDGAALTIQRLNELRRKLELNDENLTVEWMAQSIEALESQRRSTETVNEDDFAELGSKLKDLAQLLATPIVDLQAIEKLISRRKNAFEQQRDSVRRLSRFTSLRLFSEERSIRELGVDIKVIRKLLSSAQAAIVAEVKAVGIEAEAIKRKNEIQVQLSALVPKVQRFRDAEAVFDAIQTRHSLSAAMEDALRQNKVAIESIFNRIHSPAEFSGLSDMTTLRRKGGGEAKLNQVSTGQRAAFALSLFLAQNAQLRSAPPLILIDDPIAHVDDLNCLSFLDYLRELAISGERQIVFATANDKLASLFERKFDFLGESGFRHLRLSR